MTTEQERFETIKRSSYLYSAILASMENNGKEDGITEDAAMNTFGTGLIIDCLSALKVDNYIDWDPFKKAKFMNSAIKIMEYLIKLYRSNNSKSRVVDLYYECRTAYNVALIYGLTQDQYFNYIVEYVCNTMRLLGGMDE
jgi:hypothetical protein